MAYRCLLISIALIMARPAATCECAGGENIVDAYSAIREVASEARRLRAHGYEATRVECVELSGGCGFAGCSVSILVIQHYQTPRINPQSASILGRVQVTPSGEIASAERVSLASIQTHPAEAEAPRLQLEQLHRAPLEGKARVVPERPAESEQEAAAGTAP